MASLIFHALEPCELTHRPSLKCPLAAHWRCLAGTQRDEILKAVQARDLTALNAARGKDAVDTTHMSVDGNKGTDSLTRLPPKRPGLESHQTTEFICSMCSKGGVCMGCKNVALEPESLGPQKPKSKDEIPHSGSTTVTGGEPALPNGTVVLSEQSPLIEGQYNNPAIPSKELLFRCKLCKRLAHYAHLPSDRLMKDSAEEVDVEAIAESYQRDQDWSCADCVSFVYRVEKILAWRPYPANAPQPELPHGESISPKIHLPREYLVKWQDRSYRRVQWLPHGWLASVHSGLLRNFLIHGPKVELLEHAVREDHIANAVSEGGIGRSNKELDESRPKGFGSSEDFALSPSLDAERRIPPAWKTIDRVLDVLIWSPSEQRSKTNKKGTTRKERVASADPAATSDAQKEWDEAFELGEVPSAQNTRTVDQWEVDEEVEVSVHDIDRVVWAFIKWDDLGYDEGKQY
jgi:chromodomain-helicase-DNA-binding protein 4